MEQTVCNLCERDNYKVLLCGEDYTVYSLEEFRLVRCRNCGLVYLNPRPKPEEISKYYLSDYYKAPEWDDPFSFLKRSKGALIEKFAGKKGRILDIGCKRGELLVEMRKRGWETYGTDISQEACDYTGKKLGFENIYCGGLLLLDLKEDFFDAVTLFNVLEHIYNPLETLKKIHRLLKNDGVLIINCPNFGAIQGSIFKDKWFVLDLPRHLYQFTPDSLRNMAEKAGFQMKRFSHFSDPFTNLVSLKVSILRMLGFYKLPKKNTKALSPRVAGAKNKSAVWVTARFLFNTGCAAASIGLALFKSGDIMCGYFRKKKI